MTAGPPIGIVTGGGGVPLELAADLQRRGIGVFMVGIAGFADPGIARYPHAMVGLGQLGSLLAALRSRGCREIVIVGALERPDLRQLRLDWGALWHLPAVLSLTRGGDDSLLRRIVRFFERQGFLVRGIGEVAPDLLATTGPIAGPPLSRAQQDAVARARAALAELSRFDIGQAVVARPDGLVAVEAVEGTRRMLARLAAIGGAGADAVLVKLPKLGQEMRIDLPTIGAGTIEEAAAAGVSAIAVAAGAAVMAERAALVARAEAAGIAVLGLAAAPAGPQVVPPAAPGDFARGEALCRTLTGHVGAGVSDVGAVVRREHVLAVEIDGLAQDRWPARLAGLPRGWGLPFAGARPGGALVLALRADHGPAIARADTIEAATRRAHVQVRLASWRDGAEP